VVLREWWRGGVIYQVYPRSFQDSNGDGIGDLPGVLRRLDYLASLGIDAIWLSPFFQSPQADMGYDVSDYKQVDPRFGSLDDFDSLVREAHARGIRIIIDQVLSHTSDRHPWFQESRLSRTNARADWYVWSDPKRDGSPPNNWNSLFGGRAWEWNSGRRQYYFHNFLIEQPDLNFHNPAVQDAVLDVMRFWLERGVDGFRLDTVNYYFQDKLLRPQPPAKRKKHLPYAVNPYDMQEQKYSKSQPENVEFLKRVRKLLDGFPERTSVGEVGDSRSTQLMADYTSDGDKLHMCYSFDMLGPEFTAEHFRTRVERVLSAGPDSWPCWSFSNHDVERHVSRWAKHGASPAALARQTATLLLSLRGSVCLYQGEELGLPETSLLFEELTDPRGIRFWPEDRGRDGCRTPIPWDEGEAPNGFTTGTPWLPVKPPASALNVQAQEADPDSLLHFYRSALAFRKAHPALVDGDIAFLKANEPVLAFRRSTDAESILCVFNLSPEPVRIALTGDAEVLSSLNADRSRARLTLGGNGYALFAEKPEEGPLELKFNRRRKRAV
jgi:alpha-glucosidase